MTEAHPPGVPVQRQLTNGVVTCCCVRWHRPVPAEEEGHHLIPTGAPFNGPADQQLVYLCPTSHSAVHACIRVHLRARRQGRTPTVAELRMFTRYVRRLAQAAMDALGPQADAWDQGE